MGLETFYEGWMESFLHCKDTTKRHPGNSDKPIRCQDCWWLDHRLSGLWNHEATLLLLVNHTVSCGHNQTSVQERLEPRQWGGPHLHEDCLGTHASRIFSKPNPHARTPKVNLGRCCLISLSLVPLWTHGITPFLCFHYCLFNWSVEDGWPKSVC